MPSSSESICWGVAERQRRNDPAKHDRAIQHSRVVKLPIAYTPGGQGSMTDFLMRMPDLATVDATVTVVAWLKEPGEIVKRGEPLLEVETDKAILPVESPVLGVLCEITALTGAEVATGQVIARLTVDERMGVSPSHPGLEKPSHGPPPSSSRQTPRSVGPSAPYPAEAAPPRASLFERNRQKRAQAAGANGHGGGSS